MIHSFLILLVFLISSFQILNAEIHRYDFPQDFFFGTASSAYQFEGAAAEGGRKPSIWDHFAHNQSGTIVDGSNGDVAVDQYHRFKEDVLLLKELGVDVYRFSISWSRFFPGRVFATSTLQIQIPSLFSDDRVNPQGLDYYNALIDDLLRHGIQPFVTLYHWDLPYAFEEIGGWRNPMIIEKFKLYAEACFQSFGDRVKYWITFNEPQQIVKQGFVLGTHAPGRCTGCTPGGDSATEPYIVAHHILISHAQVVQLYRQKYQNNSSAKIGLTLNFAWYQPFSESPEDMAAVDRINAFELGWFLNPLVRGEYPDVLRTNVGDRLPNFTDVEAQLLVNSFDFVGINHYTTHYAKYLPTNSSRDCRTDPQAVSVNTRNGVPIGPEAAPDWQYIVPLGMYKILMHVKHNYNNPEIIITENGVHEMNSPTSSLQQSLRDSARISFHQQHLAYLLAAMRDGVKVHGYITWALTDNWEWASGFGDRFGFYFIDYSDNLKRHAKDSALWFRDFLAQQPTIQNM